MEGFRSMWFLACWKQEKFLPGRSILAPGSLFLPGVITANSVPKITMCIAFWLSSKQDLTRLGSSLKGQLSALSILFQRSPPSHSLHRCFFYQAPLAAPYASLGPLENALRTYQGNSSWRFLPAKWPFFRSHHFCLLCFWTSSPFLYRAFPHTSKRQGLSYPQDHPFPVDSFSIPHPLMTAVPCS